jgi:hypothetical protein
MTVDFAITCSLVRPGRPRYPVLVHRAAALLHASFRRHLAMTPLRFANPSPSSGWVEDSHLQAVVHARHTNESAPESGALPKFNRSEPQAATLVGLTFQKLTGTCDRPRLHRFRNLAHEATVRARSPARAKAARDLCRATSGRTAGVLRFHSSLEGLTVKGALCSGTAVSSFIQTRLGHRT